MFLQPKLIWVQSRNLEKLQGEKRQKICQYKASEEILLVSWKTNYCETKKKKIHNANRNRIERKLDTGTGPGIHLLAIRRLYWPNCEDGLMIK